MNSVSSYILSGRGLKPLPMRMQENDGIDYEFDEIDRIDLNWFFYNDDMTQRVYDKIKSFGKRIISRQSGFAKGRRR